MLGLRWLAAFAFHLATLMGGRQFLPSVESMAFKCLPLAATLLFTVLLMGILFIVVVGMTLLNYFFIVVVFMQRRP